MLSLDSGESKFGPLLCFSKVSSVYCPVSTVQEGSFFRAAVPVSDKLTLLHCNHSYRIIYPYCDLLNNYPAPSTFASAGPHTFYTFCFSSRGHFIPRFA